jgi:type IV pilus assembly protein PilF
MQYPFVPMVVIITAAFLSGCVNETKSGKRNLSQAVETRLELGNRYLADGNRESARRQFMDVLQMDSGAAEAYLGIARVHEANVEYPEAENNFKKALSKSGKESRSDIEMAYGEFLWKRKRYKDGAKHFESAGGDYDFRGRAYGLYWLGRCQAELGDHVKAQASFQRALNIKPEFGEPYLELADIAFSARDYINAEQQYEQFTKFAKQNPRSLWLGIRLHRVLGHDDKVASYALVLKNLYGSSDEYLEYQRLIGQ